MQDMRRGRVHEVGARQGPPPRGLRAEPGDDELGGAQQGGDVYQLEEVGRRGGAGCSRGHGG
eukprot:1436743-Lingulodinium_polyedra.AAC.1